VDAIAAEAVADPGAAAELDAKIRDTQERLARCRKDPGK
jgi:hypothetical protein